MKKMTIRDIFGDIIKQKEPKPEIPINGLTYIEDCISDEEHANLISTIDNITWMSSLKRRVQHYGYVYDYKNAASFVASNKNNYIGELPDFLQELGKRLVDEKIFLQQPDQVIVNEYLPGQGIANHIDCVPCFGDTVVSLSLGSQCVMDFKRIGKTEIVYKLLKPKSIVIMKGEARYDWSHGIRKNMSDVIGKDRIERGRRISITFRNII